jgi:hypothetical protein
MKGLRVSEYEEHRAIRGKARITAGQRRKKL